MDSDFRQNIITPPRLRILFWLLSLSLGYNYYIYMFVCIIYVCMSVDAIMPTVCSYLLLPAKMAATHDSKNRSCKASFTAPIFAVEHFKGWLKLSAGSCTPYLLLR